MAVITEILSFSAVIAFLFFLLTRMLKWASDKLKIDPPVLKPNRFIAVLFDFKRKYIRFN